MNWFIKDAGDGKFVSLHQDANYWGLEPHDVVTAWIALSDASPDTGPMAFLPGSHRGALYDHENTYATCYPEARYRSRKSGTRRRVWHRSQLEKCRCITCASCMEVARMSLKIGVSVWFCDIAGHRCDKLRVQILQSS